MRRLLLAIGLLGSPVALGQAFDFSLMAGGTVPLLSDSGGLVGSGEADGNTTLSPLVLLNVEAPISSFPAGPLLVVDGEFGALPGESLDIASPESYKSLAVRVGISQPLSKKLNFSLYGNCGFVTRLSGDTEPRDKAPRFCGAGLRFKGDGSELAVTLNADQRLSSTSDLPKTSLVGSVETLAYQPTVEIRGRVPLYKAESGVLKGGRLSIYVDAILGMDWSKRNPKLTGGRHDVVAAGIIVGM